MSFPSAGTWDVSITKGSVFSLEALTCLQKLAAKAAQTVCRQASNTKKQTLSDTKHPALNRSRKGHGKHPGPQRKYLGAFIEWKCEREQISWIRASGSFFV